MKADPCKLRVRTATRALPAAGPQAPLTLEVSGGCSCILVAACADKLARGYENVVAKLYGIVQGHNATPVEVCLGVQHLPPALDFDPTVDNRGDVVLAWAGGYFDGYRAEMSIIDRAGLDCSITTWALHSYEHAAAARPSAGFSRWQVGQQAIATGAPAVKLLDADPSRRRLLLSQEGAPTDVAWVTTTLGQANGLGMPLRLAGAAGLVPNPFELRHTEAVFVSTAGPSPTVVVHWSVERQ